jgi:hypothetical protein
MSFVKQSVDKQCRILDYSNNTEVAAMALGVVSSNPPPLVDTLPGSSLSWAFFCPDFAGPPGR